MSDNSQKYIGRNRAPRVQIEYELETEGAMKKVELPFVMAVMSDLKGVAQEGEEAVPVAEREFEQVDEAGLDGLMERMRPRVVLQVPNKLDESGGNIPVDLTFTSMEDFSPARIAQQVEPLRQLYDARNELKTLLSMMDGRINAENLMERVLKDPALLASLKDANPDDLAAAGAKLQDGEGG